MKNKLLIAILTILLLCAVCVCASAEVRINEVMASNAVFINGRHDDWVELYNDGDTQVSLKGWYLSDDPYNPTRWAFPDNAKIAKGGYLIVYCAGETVTDGQKNALYTNFKLSSSGDTVCITDPDGNTTQVKFGPQYGNVSSGVPTDGNGWHFFETSTPGKANNSLYFDDRAEEPVILTEPGFYSDVVTVTMSCAEGQEIRYTTDCSTPTRESPLFEGAITLTKTTVVRARAFSETLLGSTVAGSTYWINDPTPIPVSVVSIYTDNDYFFSNKSGILVKGSGKVANYNQNWEYPCQIEYFDENGVRQLVQMATTRVAGHSSRSQKQKSLSVFARSALGSDTFNCAFFENRDYEEYSAIQLRMTNSDNHSCRMRDVVLGEISDGLGLYYQAGRPIILYINGKYYGHYNLREKANKDSLAQWEGITDEKTIKNIDIIEGNGMNKTQVIKGSNEDWVELINFCRTHKLNTEENLQYVLDRVDVDSLYNYAIFSMMINNYDAGNVRYYRFPGGKWKFMLHDIEAGAMNGDETKTVNLILKNRTSNVGQFPHTILAALLEIPEYKDMFLRRTAEIVESNFLYSTQVRPIYQKWFDTLSELMPRQIKTFPFSNFSVSIWRTNVNASMTRARTYPKKVINAICSKLGVSNTAKQEYFGHTLELLAIYNAKPQ
ncbi:MAG: CotH kinase family protein [Clostridia bacterium]|nr:CotH kinase family protein [Clostridia bacterium]MBR5384237.1 CotH kinase family protein [Clostridia bacterium]